jgi:[acyl-carrier-protein] S-malonyltransferase
MRVVVKDPAITLLSNRDGAVVTSGVNWVERIVAQVAAPVRWDLCMETMSDIGVTALVELVPGGTLANLAKRALPGMELLALKTPDQLDAAAAMIRAHNPASGGDHAAAGHSPEWRIVVAPAGGKFRPAGLEPGALVESGAVLGQVDARSGPVPVTAGQGGVIVEWLAEDGDPVGAGRPLARLQPATGDQGAAGAREA